MSSNIFDRISFLSFFLLIIVLPIFFLPFTSISVEAGKGMFFVVGLIVSCIFWILARFSDGKISMPRSLCLLAGLGIMVIYFLSALFGGASGMSFFGILFDVGTFWFIVGTFILMFMSAVVFREPQNARIVLLGTVLSGSLVLMFQALHLLMPKVLALGQLTAKTDTIVGSWNALGIFAGFYIISSLFVIEFFSVRKVVKLLLGIFILLSLLLIVVVNFVLVWEILGIFALLVFVYKISTNATKTREAGKIRFPVFSFVIVLISLLFFTSGQFIGALLPGKLIVANSEVSPSFRSTMSVTRSVLREHPVLGIGPNRFADAWALYKPQAINATQFWDVSFNSGSGLLPTLTATTGALGILGWVAFFLLFLITGVTSLFSSIKNNVNLETVSFFLLSLYLFVSSFFYFTGIVLFLLAFVFAGIFIGLSASGRKNGEITLSFFNDHRKSFFFMLALVASMILSVALGFKYVQRFASIPYFVKTLSATTVPDAEASIAKTLALHSNDLYLRTYAEVYLTKLNSLVSKGPSSLTELDKPNLQASLDQAVNGAQLATAYDSKNYLNFQILGTVFQTAGIIGVKDAYDRALGAYQKASELNPLNPRLKLALANVSIASSKIEDAKNYANQAISLKPDYVDALVTLSQIAKNEGNIAQAISYGQKALSVSPGNKDLIEYVDSLRNSGGENL